MVKDNLINRVRYEFHKWSNGDNAWTYSHWLQVDDPVYDAFVNYQVGIPYRFWEWAIFDFGFLKHLFSFLLYRFKLYF